MGNVEFPVALHCATPRLDQQVLRWAWHYALLEDPSEVERCRLLQINWFSGCLFPTIDPQKLEAIMKFFLSLFLLDDLLEAHPSREASAFLGGLKKDDGACSVPRLRALGTAALSTYRALEMQVDSSHAQQEWRESWTDYLSGLQWVLGHRETQSKPTLEDYRRHRPHSAGVYLAIHLLKSSKPSASASTPHLEAALARIICLSSDLDSYRQQGLKVMLPNELVLVQEYLGGDTVLWARLELKLLRANIGRHCQELSGSSKPTQVWIEHLLLLLGGWLWWAEETKPHQTHLNGSRRLG